MSIPVENINALWGNLLIEELYRNGIVDFFISPGSRSAPLTVAAARHKGIKTHICYDERGAAFCALGYGRAEGRPAALISTSGTAVSNYYPALIEASMDLKLKGGMNLTSEAGVEHATKGTMVKAEASATHVIKGALVQIN